MEKPLGKRSASLDLLKIVAVFIVVAVHFLPVLPASTFYAPTIAVLTGVLVPTLFAITGYLMANANPARIIRQAYGFLILFFVGELFYLPFELIRPNGIHNIIIQDSILVHEGSIFAPFFLPSLATQLWYLTAAAAALTIIFLVDKLNLRRLLPLIAVGVYGMGFLTSHFLLTESGPSQTVRLFPALPGLALVFITLGLYSPLLMEKFKKLPRFYFILALLISCILFFLEYSLVKTGASWISGYYFITLPLVVISLLLLALKFSFKNSVISAIGVGTLWVYILHVLVIELFMEWESRFYPGIISLMGKNIFVFLMVVLMIFMISLLPYLLMSRVKNIIGSSKSVL